MGLAHSPRIVTDELVLALDAGNTKSYPGSGTTWTDLSGNGNDGTLLNSPTFNSANGGYLDFDGTNDYVNCGNSSVFNQSEVKVLQLLAGHYLIQQRKCTTPYLINRQLMELGNIL